MARIRTVKPELWTDEKIVECSIAARLLFIGALNFADDNGNLVNSPKRLKMQIFPADAIDCEPLIKELIAHGLLIEYSVSGVNYLNIKGFCSHQKINRPSKTNIPKPQVSEDSVNTHGALTDGRDLEGKGMEGKGRELNHNTQPAIAGCDEGVIPDEPPLEEAGIYEISSKYAFEGNVVRLSHKDFDSWKTLFPNIDLVAELTRLDLEFTHEKPKSWFNTASAKLNYQNKNAYKQPVKRAVNENFASKNYGQTDAPAWAE